jgi:hypothetical protein
MVRPTMQNFIQMLMHVDLWEIIQGTNVDSGSDKSSMAPLGRQDSQKTTGKSQWFKAGACR